MKPQTTPFISPLGGLRTIALGTAMLLAVGASPSLSQPDIPQNSLAPLSQVPIAELPSLDHAWLLDRDSKIDLTEAPRQFAEPIETKIDSQKGGVWERLKSGVRVWRARVRSQGALSLNLGFSKFHLPEGGSLLLYTPDSETVIGPFTERDNEKHGEFWSPILPGDEAVIEVAVVDGTEGSLDLLLSQVNHGYRPFGRGGDEKSGSCNVDIICSQGDGWRDEVRSVGVYSISGVFTCTGALINNTSQDRRELFLTANHCNVSAANAASVVVYWNFENSTCRAVGSAASGEEGDGSLSQFNSGASLLAAYSPSDFTLLELDDPIETEVNPHWAGWDRSDIDLPGAVTIHHPDSDEKRISFEDDPTTTTSYLQNDIPGNGTHIRITDWDVGTTEPGSSGSPLFSPEHRIVGQLHGGFAACGNDLSDWYGRLSVSWEGGGAATSRLKDWLDPSGTGASFVNGIDLAAGFVMEVTPTLSSVCSGAPSFHNIEVKSVLGFTGNVSLSLVDLPAGLFADFGRTTVAVPGTTTLTLTGTSNLELGDHTFSVRGTSEFAQPKEKTVGITLGIYQGTPAAVTLVAPADGASNLSLAPVFEWTGMGNASRYRVQVANDPSFEFILQSFTTSATSGVFPQDLPSSSILYWRVIPLNPCAVGPSSSVFSLETARFIGRSPGVAIPDQGNGSVTDNLTVEQTGVIDKLRVQLRIDHSYVGDIRAVLTHQETGTSATLLDRPGFPATSFGCEGENIDATFDDAAAIAAEDTCSGAIPTMSGSVKPMTVLSAFIGEEIQGTWRLQVTDNASGDTGTLVEWSLIPEGQINDKPCESGFFVLDTYGARHAVGSPPPILGEVYFGNDIARDLEKVVCDIGAESYRDLAVLDGFGAVHFVQNEECTIPQTFYFGDQAVSFPQGRAVDFEVTQDSQGFWVLTDFGAIYRAGSAKAESEPALVPGSGQESVLGFDIPLVGSLRDPSLPAPGGASLRAVSLAVFDTDLDNRAEGYLVLDSMGGRRQIDDQGKAIPPGYAGGFPANDPRKLLDPAAYVWPFFAGLDIVRDMEPHSTGEGVVILDGWGGVHPVPADDSSNPVFFAKNVHSQIDPTPAQFPGLPYIQAGFDDPDTPEIDEGNPAVYGIDAGSIFADLEFSAGCEGGLYTLDRFGGVFTLGNSRGNSSNSTAPFTGSPYFFPAQRAIALELYAVGETETSFGTE